MQNSPPYKSNTNMFNRKNVDERLHLIKNTILNKEFNNRNSHISNPKAKVNCLAEEIHSVQETSINSY